MNLIIIKKKKRKLTQKNYKKNLLMKKKITIHLEVIEKELMNQDIIIGNIDLIQTMKIIITEKEMKKSKKIGKLKGVNMIMKTIITLIQIGKKFVSKNLIKDIDVI